MNTNNCTHSEDAPLRPSSALLQRLPATLREVHRARVDEYASRGLKNREGFMAIRAVFQADLLRAAHELGDALERALGLGKATVERMRDMEVRVRNYLHISRRIARNAALDVRARESEGQPRT